MLLAGVERAPVRRLPENSERTSSGASLLLAANSSLNKVFVKGDPPLQMITGSLDLAAIDIAQAQSARSLELRAATSLARLLAGQGKRRSAHDLLAPIYGWFTEGFETADLKDAKTLLDELDK